LTSACWEKLRVALRDHRYGSSLAYFYLQNARSQKHDSHFGHRRKYSGGPLLGKAREVDSATPEEA
jgi:hypothetical protein